MKKVFHVICCAISGGLIGTFAGQLDTLIGCIAFTLGVLLLVYCISRFFKNDK